MFISITEEFLDAAFASRYLDYCKLTDDWRHSKGAGIWSERIIHHAAMPPDIRQGNLTLLEGVERKIKAEYGISEELYPDYLGLVRWRIHDLQRPHADAENPDGSKHEFHWRKFGCVLYLNDDYEGGEIYFPNQDIELKPKPNTLIFFPGTLEFLHAVREVTSGVRYTLTSFWTPDRVHGMLKHTRARPSSPRGQGRGSPR